MVIYKEIQSNEWINIDIDNQTKINSVSINNFDEIVIVTDLGGIKIYKNNDYMHFYS